MAVRNAGKIAGLMVLGVLGASVLTFGTQSVLRWQAKSSVETDLHASAQLMLERASSATQAAMNVLGQLAQSSGLSCTNDDRFQYSEASRAVAWVDTIGLVDRNGNLVCTDIGQSSRQVGLLPTYQANGPEISLSLSQSNGGALSLLVVRHIENGRRLVARIPGELIKLDPIRNDLRRYRTAMLSLGANDPWYILEPLERSRGVGVAVKEGSDFLPFAAQVSISENALDAVTADTRAVVNALGLILGLLAMVGGYYAGRYRPDEADKILQALDNGEFQPYLQPIVDINSGRITGCEVLARWNLKGGGSVPPHEFIPRAQACNLTREITCSIMEDARDLVGPLVGEGTDFKVSFNLFSSQLADSGIVRDIEDVFSNGPVSYSNLIFEISDRVPLGDGEQAQSVIREIQALGAEIALDDVGSGYSGLHNLTEIGVDILKLDKILVDSLKRGLVGAEVFNSMIELSGSLNIGVIAEGVETEDQVAHLKMLGVTAAQGFLFSPALPGRSFVELVKASRGAGAREISAKEPVDSADVEHVAEVAT